jgi:hypothetical protein
MTCQHQDHPPPGLGTEYQPGWRAAGQPSPRRPTGWGKRVANIAVAFLVGAAVFLAASTHLCDKGVKWLEAIAPLLGGVLCSAVVLCIRHPLLRLLLLLLVLSLSPLYLWVIHR